MSGRRRDPEAGARTRISVSCSTTQKEIIEQAAKTARTDHSTWMLAHLPISAGAPGSPIIIAGAAADRLRALAARQAISPDRALEQLLIANANGGSDG